MCIRDRAVRGCALRWIEHALGAALGFLARPRASTGIIANPGRVCWPPQEATKACSAAGG
eukprot:5428328-Prymnesium_polylepis.2